MAKDVKMIKGNDEIQINELNIAHYEKLGYKVFENKPKQTKEKKSWQPTTEKKVSLKSDQI